MKSKKLLKDIGEMNLIAYIEELIHKKSDKQLIRDDAFFYSLDKLKKKLSNKISLVSNSDMLVSTTDVPEKMEFFQIGRKSILMNLSDLIVKGVKPSGLILSLGLPDTMILSDFEELMNGVISYSNQFDLDYIGGDLNQTREIIINPTVFGFAEKSRIIYRKGMNIEDIICINRHFGLTGVGFDILLRQEGNYESFPEYKEALDSVLKPSDLGLEGILLSQHKLATASIDSSDGLSKSLRELKFSNPQVGIEISLDKNLIHPKAIEYSEEFDIPIEKLVLDAGEEFIHMFSLQASDFQKAKTLIEKEGGSLFKIGKVISEPEIFISKYDKKSVLKSEGYEHFK